jgi:hypothetical protein
VIDRAAEREDAKESAPELSFLKTLTEEWGIGNGGGGGRGMRWRGGVGSIGRSDEDGNPCCME